MRFRSFGGISRPARGGRRALIKEGGMAKRDSAPQRARQSVARWTVALVFGFLSLAFATALPAAAQSDTVPADPAPKANPLSAIVGVRASVPAPARSADSLDQARAGGGVAVDPDS